jgi:putative transposase
MQKNGFWLFLGAGDAKKRFWAGFGRRRCKKTVLGWFWAQAMQKNGFGLVSGAGIAKKRFWLFLGAGDAKKRFWLFLGAGDAKKRFWVEFGRTHCKKTVLGWFCLFLGARDAPLRFLVVFVVYVGISMIFDPEKHHRRSIRLRNYDYSQPGAYFVTICTYQKQCWCGEIKNGQMCLNQLGKIVADEWLKTPKIRPNFQLDEWIIMPNHLHGIIIINDCYSNENKRDLGANQDNNRDLERRDGFIGQDFGVNHDNKGANQHNNRDLGARNAPLRQKPNSLSSFVAGFKSAVTKRINLLRQNTNIPIWQRNYYESIVRDEKSLAAIKSYIINNPSCWQNDPDYLHIEQQSPQLYLDLFF